MIDEYRRLFKRLAGAPIGRNPSRSALFSSSSFLQEPKMRTKTKDTPSGGTVQVCEVRTNQETHAKSNLTARLEFHAATWPCQQVGL